MEDKIVELLIRSFDKTLSASEQEQLDISLIESAELQTEREQLLKVRELLGQQNYSFSAGFFTKVMAKVRKPDFVHVLIPLYRRIAFAGTAAILLLLALNYHLQESLSLDILLGLQPINENFVTFIVMGH